MKVIQISVEYILNWDYGTQKYEWYRPWSDVMKGACKIGLLITLLTAPVAASSVIRNGLCDLAGQTFVDIMNWAANFNKMTFSRIFAQIVAVNFIKFGSQVSQVASNYLTSKNQAWGYVIDFIQTKLFNSEYLPGITPFLKENTTSFVMMWISRVLVYTPHQKVKVEKHDICTHERIIDIYKNAIECNKSVLYYQNDEDYIASKGFTPVFNRALVEKMLQPRYRVIYEDPLEFGEVVGQGVSGVYDYWHSLLNIYPGPMAALGAAYALSYYHGLPSA